MQFFGDKYGDRVRVVQIGGLSSQLDGYSMELCGGTHVRRTGDIGAFKVLSDAGIAAGVRRIEAVTGLNALRYTQQLEREVTTAAALLRGGPRELVDKVQRALERQREQQKEIEQLKRRLTSGGSRDLAADAQEIGGMRVLAAQVDVSDAKAMRELADSLRDKLAPAVVALGAATPDGRVVLVCTVSKDLIARLRAGDVVKELAAIVGGGGGGRPDFAQAGGSDPSKLPQALSRLYELARAV
jgi:alanyl-tRNA synthetase